MDAASTMISMGDNGRLMQQPALSAAVRQFDVGELPFPPPTPGLIVLGSHE